MAASQSELAHSLALPSSLAKPRVQRKDDDRSRGDTHT